MKPNVAMIGQGANLALEATIDTPGCRSIASLSRRPPPLAAYGVVRRWADRFPTLKPTFLNRAVPGLGLGPSVALLSLFLQTHFALFLSCRAFWASSVVCCGLTTASARSSLLMLVTSGP
jgi:hypothetical protein